MAKSNTHNRQHHKNENSRLSRLFVMIICFLSGYFVAGIYDIKSVNDMINRQISSWKGAAAPSKKSVVAKKADIPKPKFEFYTLLANEEAKQSAKKSIPSQSKPLIPSPTVVAEAKPAVVNQSAKAERFVLQIASYKSAADAERVKAGMILKGYDVKVIKVASGSDIWYRIMLGPFPDKIGAEKAQTMVAKSEHVLGMIRKVEVS